MDFTGGLGDAQMVQDAISDDNIEAAIAEADQMCIHHRSGITAESNFSQLLARRNTTSSETSNAQTCASLNVRSLLIHPPPYPRSSTSFLAMSPKR